MKLFSKGLAFGAGVFLMACGSSQIMREPNYIEVKASVPRSLEPVNSERGSVKVKNPAKLIDMTLPEVKQKDPSPRYTLFRAEGQAFWKSALSGVSYFRKYFYKKPLSSPDLMEHFKRTGREWKSQDRSYQEASDVRLAFVGDIMWMRNQWESFVDENLREHLEGYDLLFGNLESPISSLHPVPRRLPDYPSFNSDPGLLRSFRSKDGRSLWSALSFANNHTLDRGDEGAIATLDFLEGEGIPFSGVGRPHRDDPLYVSLKQKGIHFGFYASSWGQNDMSKLQETGLRVETVPGLAPLEPAKIDLTKIREVLQKMEDDGVEFKIVSLHWGYEFELYPDLEIMRAARAIIAEGADLIIGSHPHVQQPYEICHVNPASNSSPNCAIRTQDGRSRRGLIAYSMGNFATAMVTPSCRLGVIESIHVYRDNSGQIQWRSPESQYIWNRFKPTRKMVLVTNDQQYIERQGTQNTTQELSRADQEGLQNLKKLMGYND